MPKTVDIRPVTRPMDARSAPDEVQLGGYRYVQNFRIDTKNKLCRMPGWDKFLTRESYNNQDLHDQLLAKTGQANRLPLTFLFETISTRKATKLIAGSSKVLYAINIGTGNWKVISDKLGAENTRWKAGQIGDTVVFTNNSDALVYWQFDQGIIEANDQSVAPIPDLRDELKITKAGGIIAWKGHLFLFNVVVDGAVRSSGVYWCNFNKPLDWVPGEGSTAGNADLDYGETILAAMPLADRLLFYTNKSIYECFAVGGEQVFAFQKRYTPKNSEGCLFYPNTLVSTGGEHVYAGADGIYVYSLFVEKPSRTEWMHKASSVMFDQINRDLCEVHVAEYFPERKEILFSYAKNAETLPSETLVFSTAQDFSYVIDQGFPAMANFVLKEPVQILRDFLKQNCICSEQELTDYWNQFEKEGGFCVAQPEVSCPNPPQSIYTQTPKTISYDGDSVTTEDYDAAVADEDSLCAQLDGLTLNQLCESEARADECNSGQRFVVASASDYCLKEFSRNFYRETTIGFTGCGSYRRDGYVSILRSGPINAGVTEHEKVWRRFELEANHVEQTTPSRFELFIGNHAQAVDPNEDNCGIAWDQQDSKEIKCLGGTSASANAAVNVRTSETYAWPLYYVNNYLYFELRVTNPAINPPNTGGDCCISRFSIDQDVVTKKR